MHDASNFSDVHLEFGNLLEDSRQHVASISTPSGLFTFESIITPKFTCIFLLLKVNG